MTKDDTEIVSALQSMLADKVGRERYELWFGANTQLRVAADCLTVTVPNTFYEDWLRRHFRRAIDEACQAAAGRELRVAFEVDTRVAAPAGQTAATAPGAADSPPLPRRQDVVIHAGSAAGQLEARSGGHASGGATCSAVARSGGAQPAGRRFATLDTFVSGAGSRLALAAAAEVIEQPGRVSPLLIHGATGVGKTHLLEGIYSAAKRRHGRLNAVYLSAEQFTSYFLEALRTSGVPNFRGKYRGTELLLIDDLQFLAGKKATVGELVHTIDALVRSGRQLVFSADRPVAALAGLGPELTTRLSAGLACRIDPSDYETRLGIVRAQAARIGCEVPDEVVELVATNFVQHARELHGALLKLHATSRALGQPITLTLAVEALEETMSRSRRAVKLSDVQQAVCEVFGVEPQALRSDRRTSAVAHPRMLAMWLARKHTRAALAEIGAFFGKRSHTTVISANKKIGQWMSEPQSIRLADRTVTLAEAVRKVEERLLVG